MRVLINYTLVGGMPRLNPHPVLEQVKDSVGFSENGYLHFDDPVADNNLSFAVELVRRQ